MKHLFHVHSHITFLVSKQYVFDKRINPNDCMFLCARNYQLPQEYINIFSNIIIYPEGVFHIKEFEFLPRMNLFQGYRNINTLEKFIRQFSKGDTFIYYTFYTAAHLSSVIVTMHECKGYYLIEEGSAAYNVDKLPALYDGWKHFISMILLRLFKRFFILKDHIFSSSTKYYLGTIASSTMAFQGFSKQKIIVTNPFSIIQIPNKPDVILSVDGALVLNNIPLETIEKLYIKIRGIINKENKFIVAYKFHPLFSNDSNCIKLYRDIIQKVFGQSSIELPPTMVLENLLNTYKSDFYSDYSSVGIYANALGVRCFSYVKLLMNIYPNLNYINSVQFENFPQIIKQSYIFIE